MMTSTNPSNLTPITESINGTWKLVHSEGTSELMQKRKAGPFRDDLLKMARQTFSCDGKNFSQVQNLHRKDVDTMSCEMDKAVWKDNVRVWSEVKDNVLVTNQVQYLKGGKKIFQHEKRFIVDGKLRITNHFDENVSGKMEECQCLRIFERVSKEEWTPMPYEKLCGGAAKKLVEEVPKVAEQKMKVPIVPKQVIMEFIPTEDMVVPAEWIPIEDEFDEEEGASEAPMMIVPVAVFEKKIPMFAEDVPEHLPAGWQVFFAPRTMFNEQMEIEQEFSEFWTPMVVETMETENMMDATSTQDEMNVVPEDVLELMEEVSPSLIWKDDSLTNQVLTYIKPDHQVTINGTWKLQQVYGWTDFMAAGQIDQELVWAASNISIFTGFKEVYTFYSTPTSAMDHFTQETLEEPMDKKNGTMKTTYFEDNSLISITRDKKTDEEVSKMVRYIEDGKLVSKYQCGEYKFEIHHEKA